MPYDEPADLIASCESTLDTVALLLGDIAEEVPDTPGDWTIAEILNHLLDAERRFFARVRRLKRETNPRMRVMPADVTALTALQAWKAFYELRRRHVRLLRTLKAADWRRSGTLSPGVGKVTIAGIVRHLAAHDAAHTAQIARRLSGRPR
jgi:uncharacterized damage-inducible protein DinB